MAAKKRPARRKTVRKVTRKTVTRRPPRGTTWQARLAVRLAMLIARAAETHRDTARARRDAAILRQTHAGCATCHGTGTIATHGKDGRLTGSKPCTAKPATITVSRVKTAAAARFGVDKHSGLIGWRCPCGAKEKPRYRDAKTATAALRTHERKKHGGATVGGAWYQQLPETAKTTATPATVPVVSKPATGKPMTDAQWEKQNKKISPAVRKAKGLCWQCTDGALYTAFGGVQKTVVCGECQGTGKATVSSTP